MDGIERALFGLAMDLCCPRIDNNSFDSRFGIFFIHDIPAWWIEYIKSKGDVWFVKMEDMANHVRNCINDGSYTPRIEELILYGQDIGDAVSAGLIKCMSTRRYF